MTSASKTARRAQTLAARKTLLLFPPLARFYARGWTASYVLLRIAFGLTIVTHGLPKLTGSAHGSMANPLLGSTNLIENALGLPFAPQLAVFIAVLETFGGLAVAVGAATRLFAPVLAIQMAVICFALGPDYPGSIAALNIRSFSASSRC